MTNGLAKQLRDLRLRVGNPSVRELERLMHGAGRHRPMARSTIQDKLSGKSAASLHQLLSLVAAIAEFGRRHGTPLSTQEVDENSWRAKFVAANAKHSPISGISPVAEIKHASIRKPLNLLPFQRAGMFDLVDLIEQSEGAPVSTWLPHVTGEMTKARIPCDSLMEWVAEGTPHEVIQCIIALDEAFPVEDTNNEDPWFNGNTAKKSAIVEMLLRYAARVHGSSTPVITAGLRRADAGEYVETFLTLIACWHLPPSLQGAVLDLNLAQLAEDAKNLLHHVGARRRSDRIMEVVRHFDEFGTSAERDIILAGMASDKERFMVGMKQTVLEPELQDALLASVQPHMRQILSEALNVAGMEEQGTQLAVPGDDELPF
ncbi:hypothetical protein GT045_12845 [Streptomyces sp. SID486]|uniref:hypothetical protein n=1 Tax=Streptomyces sp. SID486 TaxID=2690264 RepID=UPI00136B456B|nr:hypothetical protein [Streptomyces sp. SID486]MYX95675.1 hypothetical protein [Streptomyces sp. SID486]